VMLRTKSDFWKNWVQHPVTLFRFFDLECR
jgi:hypothetical protein